MAANQIKFIYGTEAQILALTPESLYWVEKAFYYPEDKSYFYQIVNNVLVKYGQGDSTSVGIGITLNNKVIGGVKTKIENDDVLDIPLDWEYNCTHLVVEGVINNNGELNIL